MESDDRSGDLLWNSLEKGRVVGSVLPAVQFPLQSPSPPCPDLKGALRSLVTVVATTGTIENQGEKVFLWKKCQVRMATK